MTPNNPSSNTPPPHLSTPTLEYLTEDGYADFHAAVAGGFHEEVTPEARELDRPLTEWDRFFGFTVGVRWVSTCGAFSRTLTVPGGAAVPVAAVTVVTVQPPYRRRGLLTAMMAHQLADAHGRGEPVAALWASESSIYGRFGYGQAAPRARLSGATRASAFLPAVDLGAGSVGEVGREEFLPAADPVHQKLIAALPGMLDRPAKWWQPVIADLPYHRGGAGALRYALHYDPSGAADGFATYRVKGDFGAAGPDGEVRISEVEALTPAGYSRLWRYLLDLDLVRHFVRRNAPLDDPVRHLLADSRAVRTELSDGLYVRLLDVPKALAARRYATAIDVVFEIDDPLLAHNSGRFRLQGDQGGATVRRTHRSPEITLGIRELGDVYLGGPTLSELHRAGLLVEHRAGAVEAASVGFRADRAPFCADDF